MNKEKLKKYLATAITLSVVASSGLSVSYAVSGSEVAADGEYTTDAITVSGDEFDTYPITVKFYVGNGKFTGVSIPEGTVQKSNLKFKKYAEDQLSSLIGRPATLGNVEGVNAQWTDATSSATYTFNAAKDLIKNKLSSIDPAPDKLIYGKVNLTYGDFYFGELNNVEEVDSTLKLEAQDRAKEFRSKGYYDGVSSATAVKYKSFPTTYYTTNDNGDTGGRIEGVKDVNVAISKKLYDEVKNAISNGAKSNNRIIDIVKAMRLNKDGEQAPTEYKKIGGDGILSKTVESKPEVVENAASKVVTKSKYGNYMIVIDSEKVPDIKNVDGVILKTEDGKAVGLKHLENIWKKPNELAFAVEDECIVKGNKVNYLPYKDLQGKKIKEIHYLVKNGKDVVFKTDLQLKKLLTKNHSITIGDKKFEDGVTVNASKQVPDDANYMLSDVRKGKEQLIAGNDYTINDNDITFRETAHTGIGGYTAVYTSPIYEDVFSNFILTSNHKAGDVKIQDNMLVLPKDLEKETYYGSISEVIIDGQNIRGKDIVKAIFGDNLTVNFDATTEYKGKSNAIFTKGKPASYEITLKSLGYPDVSGVLNNSDENTNKTDGSAGTQPDPANKTDGSAGAQPDSANKTDGSAGTQPDSANKTDGSAGTQPDPANKTDGSSVSQPNLVNLVGETSVNKVSTSSAVVASNNNLDNKGQVKPLDNKEITTASKGGTVNTDDRKSIFAFLTLIVMSGFALLWLGYRKSRKRV